MLLFKKKPKEENLEELRDITDDVIEGDFVPYACHWDPYTVVTKNGEVLQVIKITGFVHEQLARGGEDDSDLRSQIREAILSCIDTTQYAVWIHTIRRKKNLETEGEFTRDFAGYLNRFWNDRNDWEHQFTNEVYLTIVREGEGAKFLEPRGFVRGIIPHFDIRHREEFLDNTRDGLSAVVQKMLPVLERYGARRLGVVQQDGVYHSEISAFLGKLITMSDLDFPLDGVDLSHSLTDYDVTFGFNAMEVRMRADGKRRFGAILTVKEYRELAVGTLDNLLQIPAELIISQCFDFINAKRALKTFEYQKELFDASKATFLAEKTGLTDILGSNQGRATDFGEHQLSIFLLADSLRAMENGVAKAAAALATLGMITMREDIKLEECYWAQLPANFEFVKRMRPINTARLGGFANLSNFPAGEKENNHWGPAVTTFYTAARTPYFFNFHEADNGHTTIIGPFGTGKTVLMNFLLAQARKFNNKLFFFDKARGSEIFLRSIGGAYVNPYPKADERAYAQVSLNPFRLDNSSQTRDFLSDWMMSLVKGSKDEMLRAICDKAIAKTMMRPQPERHLSACVEAVRGENPAFADLFSAWVGQGEHAALFDHAEETLVLDDKIYGFEMGDIIRHKDTIVPALSYLLYRITLALDGTPAIIVIDEAWTMLDNPLFSSRLEEWLDGLQANNAMAILATEHVEEAALSTLNSALKKHIATQIYLPDHIADNSYADAFGLTEKEISYLTVMKAENRHFLLKRGGDTVVAELNLAGMKDIIAVLSATPQHLQAMEKAIEAQGILPSHWMPRFLESI